MTPNGAAVIPRRLVLGLTVLLATAVAAAGQSSAGILYAFASAPATPAGGVIESDDGSLYGTTYWGGLYQKGTVYRLDRSPSGSWTASKLHDFAGPDGYQPYASLAQGSDGAFYGTTRLGGDSNLGTVFRVTADGALTRLHSFSGTDGAAPLGALLQGRDGNFYGTTLVGGSWDRGTIFRMSPGGVVSTLHSFTFGDGAHPVAGLVQGADGSFYGTTFYGGSWGAGLGLGTIFKMTPTGVVTTLHVFADQEQGWNPAGKLVQGRDGGFYGTTYGGGAYNGGTVFKITTSGAFHPLYAFDGPNGFYPARELVLARDGNFYGTTLSGGLALQGTIYRMTPAGVVTKIHDSYVSGMDRTLSGLIESADGTFYGTSNATTEGDEPLGVGAVYNVTTNGDVHRVHWFRGEGGPPTSLIQASDGVLYGTEGKGTNVPHSVFKVTTTGDFQRWLLPEVGFELSRLVEASDGNFYGAARTGGSHNQGTVFRLSKTGASEVLHHFSGDDGARPDAGLIQAADGHFFGTTSAGGADDLGTVFRMTALGAVTTLYSFSGPDGAAPVASLLQATDGNFYGTTRDGGASGRGTVFRMTPSGTLATLHSFSGPDGALPSMALVEGLDGDLYGTTLQGPSNFGNPYGTIFKITTDGDLTTLHAFTGMEDGTFPTGRFFQARDGNFYGFTSGLVIGFPPSNVFRMTPSGTVTSIYYFGIPYGIDGFFPTDLFEGVDGAFYGVLGGGGPGESNGTVFRLLR